MTINMQDIESGKRAAYISDQRKASQWGCFTRGASFALYIIILMSLAFISWGCVCQ